MIEHTYHMELCSAFSKCWLLRAGAGQQYVASQDLSPSCLSPESQFFHCVAVISLKSTLPLLLNRLNTIKRFRNFKTRWWNMNSLEEESGKYTWSRFASLLDRNLTLRMERRMINPLNKLAPLTLFQAHTGLAILPDYFPLTSKGLKTNSSWFSDAQN